MPAPPQSPDRCVLAGDIGGTSLRLAVFRARDVLEGRSPVALLERHYSTADYTTLGPAVADILRGHEAAGGSPVEYACIGIAGPVEEGRAALTANTGLRDLDEVEVARECGLRRVRLINDFTAVGLGITLLGDRDCREMLAGGPAAGPARTYLGNPRPIVFAGAGTGLGVGFVAGPHVYPSEGGHATFAPRTQEELDYCQWLREDQGTQHVSYERFVSGGGLRTLHSFLFSRPENRSLASPALVEALKAEDADVCAVLSSFARTRDPYAEKVFRMFYYQYGAFVSSLACTFLPSCIFIAGGIAARNMDAYDAYLGEEFAAGYLNKGRVSGLVREVPVRVITQQRVGLYGAARQAALDISGEEE